MDKFTTSITLPKEWWDTLQNLSFQRKMSGAKRDTYSVNALMLEAMAQGMEDFKLDVLSRSGAKKHKPTL